MRARFPKNMGHSQEKLTKIKEKPLSITIIVRRIQKCSEEAGRSLREHCEE